MKQRSKQERDAEILAKFDEYASAPENKYLMATPLLMKVAAFTDTSYPTVLKVLKANGRYSGR